MFNRKPKDAIIPYPNNNIDIKNISNKIMPDPDTDLTKNILDEMRNTQQITNEAYITTPLTTASVKSLDLFIITIYSH